MILYDDVHDNNDYDDDNDELDENCVVRIWWVRNNKKERTVLNSTGKRRTAAVLTENKICNSNRNYKFICVRFSFNNSISFSCKYTIIEATTL